MSDNSDIEWTDATWNPIRGCSRVSEGGAADPVDVRGRNDASARDSGSVQSVTEHGRGNLRQADVESRSRLNWVVAGCESGPGARPCDVAWLRSLRDQCAAAGVAFFLKQAVETPDDGDREDPREVGYSSGPITPTPTPIVAGPGSKRKAGGVIGLPCLDGVQHVEMPEVRRG